MDNVSSYDINIPSVLNSRTILPVIVGLNDFVNNSDARVLNIDFSDTVVAYPGGLTPLAASLLYLKDAPKCFECRVTRSFNAEFDNYLTNMDFYKLFGKTYDCVDKSVPGSFQELYSFSKNTYENDINLRASKIAGIFAQNSDNPNFKDSIGWCITEIVDNAYTHSNSDVSVIFAQHYKNECRSEFCVADTGIGIRRSMDKPDIFAALRECITRAKGPNSKGKGNGLYYSSQLVKGDTSKKSMMTIHSENAVLTISNAGEAVIKPVEAFWNGVIVTFSVYNNIESSLSQLKKNDGFLDLGADDFGIGQIFMTD